MSGPSGRLHWWVDAPATGDTNMRRDRALLDRAEHDAAFPLCLRVYAWRPAAVSLGFHQSEDALDRAALARDGIDLVRRPTGGAAVLHDDEITYAVVGRLGTPGLGRRVLEIHDAIAGGLRDALVTLGIDARPGGAGRPVDFACFASAGGHEITVHGRKLVGSALRRTRHAFLQHGSLLVGPGHERLSQYLPGALDVAALRARTITLRELGAAHRTPHEFAEALGHWLAERTTSVARHGLPDHVPHTE